MRIVDNKTGAIKAMIGGFRDAEGAFLFIFKSRIADRRA